MTKMQTDWFEIEPKSDEFTSWKRYFIARYNFLPFGMKEAQKGRLRCFLVPVQWPEWFDEKYAGIDQAEIDLLVEKFERKPPWVKPSYNIKYGEMTALYGRPLGRFEKGTKWAHFAGRFSAAPKPWTSPSDSEVRANFERIAGIKPAEEIEAP